MTGWPAGVGRAVHETLDSTNAEALRRAATEAGPFWIMARRQTGARGRRGSRWHMSDGDFAATMLMSVPGTPAEAALRCFVAGLALHEALSALAGCGSALRMKWPNDLLIGGRKLAGILLETAGPPLRLAVGIGVNLRSTPPAEALAARALAPVDFATATGQVVAPEVLLDHLAPAFADWEARLAREGFAPLRAAWLERAAHLGERVAVRLPDGAREGRFETIDATGALVLATEGGTATIQGGEVHFGAAEAVDAARD
jgi:BirA family transcriptional regulator, biotin operon repressor / biotin---[acetyl-CoA-carboxylase] ligase